MADFIQVRGFEEAIRPPVRPKRARITDHGTVTSRSRADMAPRARLDRIARRVPEVMVKITGRTKDGGHLAAHLAYISRNAALPLEGPDGERLETRDAVKALATDWMAEVAVRSVACCLARRRGRATGGPGEGRADRNRLQPSPHRPSD